MSVKSLSILCCSLAAVSFDVTALPTMIRVGSAGDYTTIQAAINYVAAHPGDYDVRVHTGVYNESLAVVSMSTGTLVIRGGYLDGYATQAPDGALNTIVSPGPNLIGAQLSPSGGNLTVADINFFGAQTASFAAGVYVATSGGASVNLTGLVLTENVIEMNGVTAVGAGVVIAAAGNAAVTVNGSLFQRNRVSVIAGTGVAEGAGLYADCKDGAFCAVTGNTFEDQTIEARNAPAYGGALYVRLRNFATAQVDDNRIRRTHGGTLATLQRGRSMAVQANANTSFGARRNAIEGAEPLAGTGVEEVFLELLDQSSGTFGDSLVAQSPLVGVTADVQSAASAHLVNLTVADNHRGINVLSTSSSSSYVGNCLITNVASENFFQGTVFATNWIGPGAPFTAPSQYDYSLRRASPSFVDAGTDAPNGALGVTDIDGGPRLVGAHVDIGAWEFSDRIFADRFDP